MTGLVIEAFLACQPKDTDVRPVPSDSDEATIETDTPGSETGTPAVDSDTGPVLPPTDTMRTGTGPTDTADSGPTPTDTAPPPFVGGPRFEGTLVAEDIAIARILGSAQDFLAKAITNAGDAVGDEHADVIVDVNLGDPNGVHAFAGPFFGKMPIEDSTVFISCGQCTTVSAGDLNTDGRNDYWMGPLGATYIVHGPLVAGDIDDVATSKMNQDDVGGGGQGPVDVIGSARDVNGDSIPDALFGDKAAFEPEFSGAAWLLHGPLPDGEFRAVDLAQSSWLGDWDVHINFGRSLLLDLDADGLSDAAIGCGHDTPTITVPGAVHLHLSPIPPGAVDMESPDGLWTGESNYSRFFTTHARAGDIDGDGREDLLPAARSNTDAAGENIGGAYVILGPGLGDHSAAESYFRMYGECVGDGVAEAGDIDSDGHDDLFIGDACYADLPGAVFLFYGPVGSGVRYQADADARIEVADTYPGTSYGSGLAVPGDVTGDGWNDIVVTAQQYPDPAGGDNAGAVFLFDPSNW